MTDTSWAQTIASGEKLSVSRPKLNDNFAAARRMTVEAITNADSPYSPANDADLVEVDASGGAVTVIIGDGTETTGQVYWVSKRDSSVNAVTVQPASDTIDGSASVALSSQYDVAGFVRLGSEWTQIV